MGEDGEFLLEKLSPSIVTYSESGTAFGNYGDMRLRGIDGSRINITLNGAPLNDMIDEGVFFSNFIDFGSSIQSVQVQRGVGTSTNGTSSYAGSISFESLNMNDSTPYTELQFLGGSFNTFKGSAELYSGKNKHGLSFYTRFSSFKSAGYKYHTSTNSYSFFMSGGYSRKHDEIKLTGFTGRSRNGLGYLPVAISDIKADPRTNYVNENDIDNFGQSFLQLQETHHFHHCAVVSSFYFGSAGGDYPSGEFVTDSIFSNTSPGNYYLSNRLVQINYPLFNRHYGFLSNYSYTSPSGNFDFYSGIHLYTFHRHNLESVLPDNAHPYYNEKSRKDEASTFARAEYHLGKFITYGDVEFRTLTMIIIPDPGYLPDVANIVKNWTFVNPKVGLTYTFDQTKNAYLFFGRGYREPTKIDILGGYELYPSNYASAITNDVKPEEVNDLESGFRIAAGDLHANINIFNMNFHNEIAPIGKLDPDNFIQLRKNIKRSNRRGIELDCGIPVSNHFSLDGDVTYMRSRIKVYAPEDDPKVYTNVTQALSPDLIGSTSFIYHDRKFLEASVTGKFMSKSYLEPTNNPDLVIPSFFILSAKVKMNIMKTNSITLAFDNLLNKIYFTNGTPVEDESGNLVPGYLVEPPRNFYALVSIHF